MQAALFPHWLVWPSNFVGVQPGEQLLLNTRPHPFRLLMGSWPLAIGLLGLVALLANQRSAVLPGLAWGIADVLVLIVVLVLFVHWLVADAYHWWFTRYVISDRRVIRSFLGIARTSVEIPLDKVQTTRAVTGSPIQWLLGIGAVEIAGAAGEYLVFNDIAAPHQVKNQILEAQSTVRTTRQASQGEADDPGIRQIIERLGKPDPLPSPAPLPTEASIHWPLSRAMHTPLERDEQQLGIISRHWWALVMYARIPLLLFVAAIGVAVMATITHVLLGIVSLFLVLIGIVWGLLAYLNFADDLFILTNRRIIDVDRHYFILYETLTSIEYGKIQVVESTTPSFWARLLGYGNITIKSSAGSNKDAIVMRQIPHSKQILDVIERSRTALKQRGEIQAENARKDTMKEWFTSMVGELFTIAPDLRGKPIEEAMAQAEALGLGVAVMADPFGIPSEAAGVVVAQNPRPGVRCLRGSDLSVMLSRP